MKIDTKWINNQKMRRTLSPLSMDEDNIYPAHSLKTAGYVPYVGRAQLVEVIHRTAEYIGDGSPDAAQKTLTELLAALK